MRRLCSYRADRVLTGPLRSLAHPKHGHRMSFHIDGDIVLGTREQLVTHSCLLLSNLSVLTTVSAAIISTRLQRQASYKTPLPALVDHAWFQSFRWGHAPLALHRPIRHRSLAHSSCCLLFTSGAVSMLMKFGRVLGPRSRLIVSRSETVKQGISL